jgi:hypothetical protein
MQKDIGTSDTHLLKLEHLSVECCICIPPRQRSSGMPHKHDLDEYLQPMWDHQKRSAMEQMGDSSLVISRLYHHLRWLSYIRYPFYITFYSKYIPLYPLKYLYFIPTTCHNPKSCEITTVAPNAKGGVVEETPDGASEGSWEHHL